MLLQVLFWFVAVAIGLFVAAMFGGTLVPGVVIGLAVAVGFRMLLQRLYEGRTGLPKKHEQ